MGEMASDALTALLDMCGIKVEKMSGSDVTTAMMWCLEPGALVTATVWDGD